MTDAQTWTVIGGFLGLLTVGQGLVLQVINARFRGVDARFDVVDARFDGLSASVDARFDGLSASVDARFDAVTQRLDLIDRDVQRLVDVHFREQ